MFNDEDLEYECGLDKYFYNSRQKDDDDVRRRRRSQNLVSDLVRQINGKMSEGGRGLFRVEFPLMDLTRGGDLRASD